MHEIRARCRVPLAACPAVFHLRKHGVLQAFELRCRLWISYVNHTPQRAQGGLQVIRVGTSGWSYNDWVPAFYDPGSRPGDVLAQYRRRFGIVEVDSTYYRIPSPRTVRRWFTKTPDDFRFAVKAPGLITHEKILADCDAEWGEFLDAAGGTRPRIPRLPHR